MSSQFQTAEEVRRIGAEYGHELAAALVLASSRGRADHALKRQMAEIVLREIGAAVRKLENASFPPELTAVYERAAKKGVREELMKSREIAAELHRHAA